MFVPSTHRETNGTAWLTIHETHGPTDIAAFLLAELGCREDPQGNGFCLIDPPSWMYWVGGHHRYSLGGVIWHLGQWAHRQAASLPEVHRHQVTPAQLEQLGWWPLD